VQPSTNGPTTVAAESSAAPDAIGVISWNEFSENSHIEPSRQYGDQSLQTLAQLLGGQAGSAPPDVLDSSEPGGRGSGWSQAAALGSVTVLTVVAAAVLVRRHRRAARARAYAAFPGELTDFPWELIDFPWELSEDPWEQTDSRPAMKTTSRCPLRLVVDQSPGAIRYQKGLSS